MKQVIHNEKLEEACEFMRLHLTKSCVGCICRGDCLHCSAYKEAKNDRR